VIVERVLNSLSTKTLPLPCVAAESIQIVTCVCTSSHQSPPSWLVHMNFRGDSSPGFSQAKNGFYASPGTSPVTLLVIWCTTHCRNCPLRPLAVLMTICSSGLSTSPSCDYISIDLLPKYCRRSSLHFVRWCLRNRGVSLLSRAVVEITIFLFLRFLLNR
jgi:hypothetical protein